MAATVTPPATPWKASPPGSARTGRGSSPNAASRATAAVLIGDELPPSSPPTPEEDRYSDCAFEDAGATAAAPAPAAATGVDAAAAAATAARQVAALRAATAAYVGSLEAEHRAEVARLESALAEAWSSSLRARELNEQLQPAAYEAFRRETAAELDALGARADAFRRENGELRSQLDAATAAAVEGLGRAAACTRVVEAAVESAVDLNEFRALDPALKVRLELAAARDCLADDASATSYGLHSSNLRADFAVSVGDASSADDASAISHLGEIGTSGTSREHDRREIARLTLGRDAAAASAAAALRIAGSYASRASPNSSPRCRTADAANYSDAYGMRPRSRSQLPRLSADRPSIEARANPRPPRKPRTKKKGRTSPRASSPDGRASPLREYKHAVPLRKYPRNPNPKPPHVHAF